MDFRELYFFKYCLHGMTYLKFFKALKKFGIEYLIEHYDEFYYFSKYREYGQEYLKFLHDAIELELNEIVDMKGFREPEFSCILKWVFKNSDCKRRSENN